LKISAPLLLSFNGGYVDTAGFLALQGLFTAHVTGNFVTFGAAMVEGTIESIKQLSRRTIRRDRVACRFHGEVVEFTLSVGREDTAKVAVRLIVRLLVLEKTLPVCLPGFNHRAGNRARVQIDNSAFDGQWLTASVQRDIRSVRQMRRIRSVERPTGRIRRGAFGTAAVDGLNKCGRSDQIGQQDPFLTVVGRGVANRRQIPNRLAPLGAGRAQFENDPVNMLDDRDHAGRQASGAGPRDALGDSSACGLVTTIDGQCLPHRPSTAFPCLKTVSGPGGGIDDFFGV
jgi:hypothetical protein